MKKALMVFIVLSLFLLLGLCSCDKSYIGEEYLEYLPVGDGSEFGVMVGEAIALDKIEIPPYHNGKPVTVILESAFKGARASEIVIPDTITTIETGAFYNCRNLLAIHIPASVSKIENMAFFNILITCEALTEGENWGYSWENDCSVLYDVQSSGIENDFFWVKSYSTGEIELILYVGNEQPSNIVKVPSSIQGTSITEVNLYNLGIPKEAVVYLPKELTDVSFDGATFEVVLFEAPSGDTDNYKGAIVWDAKMDGENGFDGGLYWAELNNGGVAVLDSLVGSRQINIPEQINGRDVTVIAENGFANNEYITEVIIPKTVRKIGTNAFSSCSALVSVYIPSSVEEIERFAFYDSPYLTIYCEATKKQDGWDYLWKARSIDVVWGYKY